MIVLNLKTYQETLDNTLLFADIASEVVEETGVRVVLCPPSIYLKEASERFTSVFAQHVDPEAAGAFTGTLPIEALKKINAKGSLLNHSERKIRDPAKLKDTVEKLHQNALESLVCAESVREAEALAHLAPTFIAVEPPELIGSGVSVSKAKPELVRSTVNAIHAINPKLPVLCGAGVSTKQDVESAVALGTDGVLLASAFVKAKDHKKFLSELASVF
ncbi:triose-phosphate isomerase [Candidatus Micrarchaeota archaeon]|nr:triose-phosphate isomerase [Candidatus Micrarchaeota archaeon]